MSGRFQNLPPVCEEAFAEIIRELERQPIALNPYRLKSGAGRSAAFGFVNRRCLPPDISRQCWLRPFLYHLLVEFGKKHVPISWNAITINQDYAAKPHRDKGNCGVSYLVAFGDFTGGGLNIHETDLSGSYTIRHNPILFKGSELLHSVSPFVGHRYSVVYYTLERKSEKSLDQYVPLLKDGKWVLEYTDKEGEKKLLKRGEGLPHPLKRKVN